MTVPLWSWKSHRLRVAVCLALALTIEGLMRSNLNMAMVCMLTEEALAEGRAPQVQNQNYSQLIDTTPMSTELERFSLERVSPLEVVEASEEPPLQQRESCPQLTFGVKSRPKIHGTITWTSKERALIFASFYGGGFISCLAAESLNHFFGPTKLVFYGAIVNVLGTFVTPVIALNFRIWLTVVVRLIMGFGQGLLWPCMSVLVAHWFPPTEKSSALAITTTGNQLSVIIAMFTTAELCQLSFGGGWPMAFHLYGIMGLVLIVVWWIYVSDTPEKSMGISDEELEFITSHRKKQPKPQRAEWCRLMSSPLVWSIAASSFAHNFITVGTVTYLPLYYSTILNMSLTSNGILSALPFVCQFISKIIYAGFADEFKRRRWMSITNITKACNTSAAFGIGICFLLMCFCHCEQRWTAVILVCIAMSFVSGYIPGYNTSVVSISTSQTVAIAAFSRIWAQVGAMWAPYQIGATTGQGTLEEWRVVFITIGVICFVTGAFFQIYGSADVQPWDHHQDVEEPKVELIQKVPNTKEDENILEVQNTP